MKSITLTHSVVNGRLNDNAPLVKAIKSFEGQEVEIIIRKKSKIRSTYQNSYYWAVIIPLTIEAILKEWGEHWDNQQAHDLYKMKFLNNEVITNNNVILKVPKSTTENDTIDQERFHDQCRQFLKEWLNVDCPLQNENIKINYSIQDIN